MIPARPTTDADDVHGGSPVSLSIPRSGAPLHMPRLCPRWPLTPAFRCSVRGCSPPRPTSRWNSKRSSRGPQSAGDADRLHYRTDRGLDTRNDEGWCRLACRCSSLVRPAVAPVTGQGEGARVAAMSARAGCHSGVLFSAICSCSPFFYAQLSVDRTRAVDYGWRFDGRLLVTHDLDPGHRLQDSESRTVTSRRRECQSDTRSA